MNDIIIGREENDKKKLGMRGSVLLGKHYVKMGRTTSLSNKIFLDVAKSHVVFVCGKRGGGKCLTEDALITLGDGSRKKIAELEYDDHQIFSLDKDLRIKNKEKEAFYERTADSYLTITLESGKTINCTEEHPLLTILGWEEACELTIGSKIATPKIIPVFGESDVSEEKVKQVAYEISGYHYPDDEIEKERNKYFNNSQRKIPAFVYKLPKHKLTLFLNRLFSADASLYKSDSWKIRMPVSQVIGKEVQHLLLRFGILSKYKNKNLILENSNVKKFLNEIGLHGQKQKLQKIALRETVIEEDQDLDTDLLEFFDPDDWEAIGENFKKQISGFSYKDNTVNELILVDLLKKSDIYWDEVVKIEKIEKKTTVYDLTVPETNNFLANDLIVHNSYTMGVIAEGVADLPSEIRNNTSILLIDTMGIYWTMKYPNKQDPSILRQWELDSKALDVKIFTPQGYYKQFKEEGIPTDYPFAIKPSELSGQDWNITFNIKSEDPLGVLIEKTIHDLNEEEIDFDLDDVLNKLQEQEAEKHVIIAAKNNFLNAKSWGVFDKDATPISKLVKAGQVGVLDISCYATMPGGWNIKNLVVGLVCQKLFVQRMSSRKDEEYKEVHKSVNPFSDEDANQENPLVWLVIDEAHEFLPNQGKTLATDPLVTILREGRQPGISLILASQQPGKIHTDVMTQSDTVIAHRITAKLDTDALGTLMQSYMRKGLVEELDNLPREKGAAIIFDDTNERMYPMRIRPRFTWHGGGSPTAIKDKKEDF